MPLPRLFGHHLSILAPAALFLLFLLLFSLVHLTMLGQKGPGTSSNLLSDNFTTSTTPAQWTTNEPDEKEHHAHHLLRQRSQQHNTFESSRYGLKIDHCPNGGDPELDARDGRIKLCQLDAECKQSYKCESIIGLTHFGKQMRYCCPTKTSVCTLKPKLLDADSSPPCQRPLLRTFYYFDSDRLKCVRNRMPQCEEFGEHENRFPSELECRTKCETTACELGESILLHNNSFDRPFMCAMDDDCPVGYNCRQDRIFRRSVCCGFLNFEPCPLGFRSFTVPFTGRAKSCRSSATRDECPTDYVCTQNAISREQFCCTVEKGVCPEGHQAYIHPLTDGTIKCNLRNFDATTVCPPGYVCLAAVFGSHWGFCCAQAMIGASCPEDSFPQINPITNQPQRCELTQQEPSVCSQGFECETDSASHLGFCCSVRKHEKLKPLPDPMPRKRTRPPTLATTAGTTSTTTPTTTTTAMAKTTNATKRTTATHPDGAKKRKKMGMKKKDEDDGEESSATSSSASSSSASSSESEQSERADLIELSTKLDRFISGVRRRIPLPRGHLRPRPHIWRLKKTSRWGPDEIRRRIFGRLKLPEESDERKRRKGRMDEEDGKMTNHRQIRPKCPHGYRPLAYPGAKWTYLECVEAEGGKRKKKKGRIRKRKGKKIKKGPDDEEEEGGEDEDDQGEEAGRKRKRRRMKREDDPEDEAEEDEGERKRMKRGLEDAEDEDEADEDEATTSAASSVCPGHSICLRAREDPFGRALCCVRKKRRDEEDNTLHPFLPPVLPHPENEEEADGRKAEEDEDEEGEEEDGEDSSSMTTPTTTTTPAPITTTSTPLTVVLTLERSDDPACPALIAGRICAAGSTDVCREDGFFCQYNKERKEFVCCTLAKGRMGG